MRFRIRDRAAWPRVIYTPPLVVSRRSGQVAAAKAYCGVDQVSYDAYGAVGTEYIHLRRTGRVGPVASSALHPKALVGRRRHRETTSCGFGGLCHPALACFEVRRRLRKSRLKPTGDRFARTGDGAQRPHCRFGSLLARETSRPSRPVYARREGRGRSGLAHNRAAADYLFAKVPVPSPFKQKRSEGATTIALCTQHFSQPAQSRVRRKPASVDLDHHDYRGTGPGLECPARSRA